MTPSVEKISIPMNKIGLITRMVSPWQTTPAAWGHMADGLLGAEKTFI
jgi:hypothetical protein